MSSKHPTGDYHKSEIYWRQMDVPTLIKYCQSDRQLLKICLDPATWQYLLKRDFNINKPKPDPRKYYFKQILHKLSDLYIQFANKIILRTNMNQSKKFENQAFWYSIALSVLGRPIPNSTSFSQYYNQIKYFDIFGNKVGSSFYEYILETANQENTSFIQTLFDELEQMEAYVAAH